MDMLMDVIVSAWEILKDSSVFILLGFALAGMIKVFVPMGAVNKSLGGKGVKPVLKASVVGIPLTLCSCSVMPAAMTLRKMGASRGATNAFLISTPESGVDSISISYALLDPIMTVFRPAAAFVTAFSAGIAENFLSHETAQKIEGDGGNSCGPPCYTGCAEETNGEGGFSVRLGQGFRFAFVDMMDDLAGWMMLGLFIAGAISALVPASFFENYLGSGLAAMPVMLLLGVPMYVCASSSTPMAAAMIMKGLSPGAALVFLLAGPATNIGSLAIIKKFMGARSVVIYIVSIAVCAMAMGVALNGLYSWLGVDPAATIGGAMDFFPDYIELASAIVFLALAARPIFAVAWRRKAAPQT